MGRGRGPAACAVVVLVAAGACTDPTLPVDAQISCERDDDCPDGRTCRVAIARCVTAAQLAEDPIAFLGDGLVADRARVSAVAGFDAVTLSFAVNRPPRAVEVRLDGAPISASCTATDDDELAFGCVVPFGDVAAESERTRDLAVEVTDSLGTRAVDRVPVVVDQTAPGVVETLVSTTLTPPPGSPLTTVTAWGPGGVAELQLVFDEPPAITPTVVVAGAPALAFSAEVELGLLVVMRLTLPDDAGTDGPVVVEVTAEDDVGNVATAPLALALVLDRTAPAAPLVDEPGAVRVVRAPWGRAAAPTPRATVEGAIGSAEPGATIIATVGDPATTDELGRAVVDDDGAFTLPLFSAALPTATVRLVDRAGNESAAVVVREGTATLSLGGKISGSLVENPHVLRATGALAAHLEDAHAREPLAPAAVATTGGALATTGEARWTRRHVVADVDAFAGASFAFVHDARLGGFLLAGGDVTVGANAPATARYDGSELWSAVTTTATMVVPRRVHAASAYDARRGALVVFGGGTAARMGDPAPGGAGVLGDHWELIGEEWIERVSSTMPLPREGAMMAYDPFAARVVLFGGRAPDGTMRGDTWFLDDDGWRPLAASASAPPARTMGTLTVDEHRGGLILFGGATDGPVLTPRDDTWLLVGDTWTALDDVGAPPARMAHAATWDASAGRLVIIGGKTAHCTAFGADDCPGPAAMTCDVWALDDVGWSEVVTSAPSLPPTCTAHGALAHDAATDRLILVGGWDGANAAFAGNSYLYGAHALRGTTWEPQRRTSAPPPPRSNATGIYDPVNDRIVALGGFLFGGDTITMLATATSFAVDTLTTWPLVVGGALPAAFDGESGFIAFPDGLAPPGVVAGRVLFPTGVALLSGLAPITDASPVFVVWDQANDRVVVLAEPYFGTGAETTWTWDPVVGFVPLPTTGAPPLGAAQVAYDVTRARIVVYGGVGAPGYDATWELVGDTWVDRAPASTPGGRSGGVAVYDDALGRVLVTGGRDASGTPHQDTWAWDGDNWYPLPAAAPPSHRDGPLVVYDARRDAVVLYGGAFTGGSLDDVYALERAGVERPAQLLSFSLPALGAGVAPVAFAVRAVVGATGYPRDMSITDASVALPTDGAALLGWRGDRYVTLASSTAPASAPSTLTWSTEDPAVVAALTHLRPRAIDLALAPLAPSGVGGPDGARATVVTDVVELDVRYRVEGP